MPPTQLFRLVRRLPPGRRVNVDWPMTAKQTRQPPALSKRQNKFVAKKGARHTAEETDAEPGPACC